MTSGLPPVQGDQHLKVEFEFQRTDGERVSISEYNDKPILIEWAATWCSVCKRNQASINELYPEYKNKINFISLSYGLSGDTIEDVQEMKEDRGYNWTFGLDVNAYSQDHEVYNGFNWLLDSNQTLLTTWNGTIVTANDFAQSFEDHLGIENTREDDPFIVNNPMLMLSSLSLIMIVIVKGRQHD